MDKSRALLLVLLICCVSCVVGLSAPSPPSTGAYASGTYRNLFAEAGYSASEITAKLNAAWTSLFGGGSDSTVFYTVGSNMGYIFDVEDNDVRTEGMSYGMMIAVQMNEQAIFDQLYTWAVTYMRINTYSDPLWLFYNWECDTSGNVLGDDPAPDGETYFLTALIFAAGRWGSSANFNYVTEYKNLLYKMLHVPSNTQGYTNMFDAASYQIVFCPDGTAATYTDPSYHTPAFYGIWALLANSTADQQFWQNAQTAARDYFQKAFNSLGLNPDYSNFDGSIYTGDSDHQYFGFDAWRTVQNVGVDYAWWAAESSEITLVNTVLNFFYSQGTYGNEYYLNGTVMSTTHSPGHVAMNAAGALASNNNITWSFVNELWSISPPTGEYRYYDGMLYFLGLLHCSGNFKIYLPSTSGSSASATVASSSSSATTASTSTHATTGSGSTSTSSSATATASATSSCNSANNIIVYDNAVESPFADWSWATTKSATNTNPVHSAPDSYSYTPGTSYDALYFKCSACISTTLHSGIQFWINGGTSGGQSLQIELVRYFSNGSSIVTGPASSIASVLGESIPANSWAEGFLSLSGFPSGTYDGIWFQNAISTAQSTLYLDDITVIAVGCSSSSSGGSSSSATTGAASSATSAKSSTSTSSSSTTGSSSGLCSAATVTAQVTESWSGSSPQGNLQLVVSNTGSQPISTVTITFSTPISTVWSGIAAGSVSGQYVVTANANAGASVTIAGATFTGQTTAPSVSIVSEVCT